MEVVMLQKITFMKSKNFNLKFFDNSLSVPKQHTYSQYSTDEEIVTFLEKKAKECNWSNIGHIEVREENKLVRIDLVIPILRPLLQMFRPGEIVKPIFFSPLPGRSKAPQLVAENAYPIKSIIWDSQNYPHFNVGLESKLNFVTSYETGEELRDGDRIHWCHPIRFILVENKTNDAMQFIKEDSQ